MTDTSSTETEKPNSYRTLPDDRGHFGLYGGRYVAETLMPLILQVEKAYDARAQTRPSRPSWIIFLPIMSVGPARSITPNG